MNRPSWDDYFMEIAHKVAERSTCMRAQMGAVIVKDKRILTTGYNATPSGLAHCFDVGCLREKLNIPSGQRHELCRGLHAEQNAIIQAALHGVVLKGATIYITNQPCVICTKMIINTQIERVVFAGHYPDELSMELLKEAEIQIDKIEYIGNKVKGD